MKPISRFYFRVNNSYILEHICNYNYLKCSHIRGHHLLYRTYSQWQHHTKHKQPSSSSSITKRTFSSSYLKINSKESYTFYKSLILSVVLRVIPMISILHIVKNCIFISACEGPSMEPTMKASGEIILVERISHRIYGIEDGVTGNERAENASRRQRLFEEECEKVKRKDNKKDNDIFMDQPVWHQSSSFYKKRKKKRILWSKLTSGISVGDLIVLQHKEKNGTICKRVIGLPGDTIIPQSQHQQRLTVVPDGHVWIEGDNTVASNDSRNYGCVPAHLIVGKVFLKIWPLGDENMFMEFGDRPIPEDENEVFLGSLVLPAGYQGEKIEK